MKNLKFCAEGIPSGKIFLPDVRQGKFEIVIYPKLATVLELPENVTKSNFNLMNFSKASASGGLGVKTASAALCFGCSYLFFKEPLQETLR